MELCYQVDRDHVGCCVRQAARGPLHLSEKLWRKIKWNGTITVNGQPVRSPSHRLEEGDRLQLRWKETAAVIPVQLPLSILYEDEDLLVFNKPADMPCHQSCGHAADTLANVFAVHCDRLGVDLMYRPLNRLDRDTSGAVLVAKNRYAAAAVTNNFHKTYQAILLGAPPQPQGRVDAPIRREQPEQMRRIVAPDGQRAVTNYRVLAQAEGLSLVDFVLETGRTHQIRVHMAHLGCPVLGDGMYGQPSDRIARQALHCRRICFPHPLDKREITVDCPLPQDMETLAEQILKG